MTAMTTTDYEPPPRSQLGAPPSWWFVAGQRGIRSWLLPQGSTSAMSVGMKSIIQQLSNTTRKLTSDIYLVQFAPAILYFEVMRMYMTTNTSFMIVQDFKICVIMVHEDHPIMVYEELKVKVRAAVIALIDQEREGGQIERALLKNVLDIFVEIGMNQMICYETDFEGPMLDDSAGYYSRKASNWIVEDSCPDYMIKAEECLKKEKDRVSHYLHSSSESKLEERVQNELLVVHSNQLLEKEHSGCRAFLRDDKMDDLSRMYRLFCKIPKRLDPIANIFREHVTAEGTALVQQAEDATSNRVDNAAGSPDQAFIKKVIDLHDKFMAYVMDCFASNSLFHKALKEAFEVFCNKQVSGSSSAELLASFCDNILKKGGSERLSDEAIEETLDKVVKLLAYISDKDLFAEFYRKKLSRRLLFDKSANDDHERIILTKLKQQCGGQFTSKMEGMVSESGSPFCKSLTSSDASTHGGFSVLRRYADECLPPLDMTRQPPTQELVAKDLHGNEWWFRHIFRGNCWVFVAGDAFIFLRGESGELRVGVRRAMRQQSNVPSSVISSHSMRLRVLATAWHAYSTGTVFIVSCKLRTNLAEFIISYDQYMESVKINYSIGMRFKMRFEGEEAPEQRFTGTIVGIEDADSIKLSKSKWRELNVWWDESSFPRPERVSPWEIEPVLTPPALSYVQAYRSKWPKTNMVPGSPDSFVLTWDGVTNMVYPGAMDSRFEHSLGVYCLAGEAIYRFRNDQGVELGIDCFDIETVKLAGLLHDVGHGPFSHLFENLVVPRVLNGSKWSHEEMSLKMVDHIVDSLNIDIDPQCLKKVKDYESNYKFPIQDERISHLLPAFYQDMMGRVYSKKLELVEAVSEEFERTYGMKTQVHAMTGKKKHRRSLLQ